MRGGSVKQYLNDKGLGVLKALDKVAEAHQSTQATVALAWLLSRPNVGAPIASATKKSHLETIFAAPKLELTVEDIELLNEASAVEVPA